MARLFGTFIVFLLVVSCRKCGDSKVSEGSLSANADAPDVPRPEKVLAEFTIATPNASWSKLQRGIGGAVGILPSSAAGILGIVAGIDPSIVSEIDGKAPAYGVLAEDLGHPTFVIALRLIDPAKAKARLLEADNARFAGRPVDDLVELVPKGQNSVQLPIIMAIAPSGYWILSSHASALSRYVPYVTRTMPKRPTTLSDAVIEVPNMALGSFTRNNLEASWATAKAFLLTEDERMRREHGGRAADFADPKAIVGAIDGWVDRRISIVADLEKIKVTIDFSDDGVSILSTMSARQGAGPASEWISTMATGDGAPLGELPAETAIALLMRDSEANRIAQARATEQAIRAAFGPRLAEAEATKMRDVFADVNKARGDSLVFALGRSQPRSVTARVPVRDADAGTRALAKGLELLPAGPFRDLSRVRAVSTSSENVPGLGAVSRATLLREAKRGVLQDAGARIGKSENELQDVKLAWLVDHNVLTLATGSAPETTLAEAAHPARTLGQDPAVFRALTSLAGANLVFIVVPRVADGSPGASSSCSLAALGRSDSDAYLRIDVGHAFLRELARDRMGF